MDFVDNLITQFLLKIAFLILITFLKNPQTLLGYLIRVLDYVFFRRKQKILLIFYLNLLTYNVNLKLTEYQRIMILY